MTDRISESLAEPAGSRGFRSEPQATETSVKAFVVAVFLLAAACGGPAREQRAAEPEQQPTVFDPLTDTLDRAAGVEDTLRESAAERRRQLEEAEGR
jgi:hypothetical protein